jgi:hypothetical protein
MMKILFVSRPPAHRYCRSSVPADRERVHDLAVALRLGIDVDGDELVLLVAHALHPERPHVDEVLLADDLGHVGRHAGLVRPAGRRDGARR